MDDSEAGPVIPRPKSTGAASEAIPSQVRLDFLDGGGVTHAGAEIGKIHAPLQKYGKRARMLGQKYLKNEAKSKDTGVLNQSGIPVTVPAPSSPLAEPASSSSTVPTMPRPRPKKPQTLPITQPTPEPTGLDDLSDLTSLSSSDTRSSSPESEADTVGAKHKPFSGPSTAPIRGLNSKPLSPKFSKGVVSDWKAGTHVWVLIDPSTSRVYDQDESVDDTERIWWPGKIQSLTKMDKPLQVKLFGRGHDSVQIRIPSDTNICSKPSLSLKTPTYHPPRPSSSSDAPSFKDLFASPRKKQRRQRDEFEHRWENAVEDMKGDAKIPPPPRPQLLPSLRVDIDSDDDDLPQYISMLPVSVTAVSKFDTPSSRHDFKRNRNTTPRKRGKRKRRDNDVDDQADNSFISDDDMVLINDNEDDAINEAVPPPEHDYTPLAIPGELVLAKEKAYSKIHWPAKIEEYHPPKTKKQQGKFTVTWVDSTTGQVLRDWFYKMSQPEFGTCLLGKFSSAVVEVQDDDEGNSNNGAKPRSPSPIPLDPLPSPAEFCSLPIRSQFAYVKPILTAILEEEYEPALEKHDGFLKGGKTRQQMIHGASHRGRMDPNDVEKLQWLIRAWCVTEQLERQEGVEGEGGATRGVALGDASTSSPPLTEPTCSTPFDPSNHLFGPPVAVVGYVPPSPPLSAASCPEYFLPSSSCPISEVKPEQYSISEVPSIAAISDAGLSPPPSSLIALPVTTTEHSTAIKDGNGLLEADHDEEETNQTIFKPVRRGRATFESLSPVVKLDYCINVLLPEAIRQILLWRKGERTSLKLLSPSEEKNLYEMGQTLLEESDWVNDIIRYRLAIESMMQKKLDEKEKRAAGRNGISLMRPKRNVIKVKSYYDQE